MNFEMVRKLLHGRSSDEVAKISAYVFAPLLVFLVASSGSYAGGLAIDPEKPFAISELRTEIIEPGSTTLKPGVALIVDPVTTEYRIRLGSRPTRLWSSLDEEGVRANKDRLIVDNDGLSGRAPFIGVNEPVTVVIEGKLGKEIQIPAGSEPVDRWRLSSRRSGSVVSSILFACVFGFGLSIATALPLGSGDENAAG